LPLMVMISLPWCTATDTCCRTSSSGTSCTWKVRGEGEGR
jgi:hypothetical protein